MISHAIHEQLIRHKKACLESGLVGRTVQKELSGGAAGYTRGPKQLEDVWRQWADAADFGPRVEELSIDDMERLDFEREKAAKCVLLYGIVVVMLRFHGADELSGRAAI